jgi:hypothetical protein
VRGSPDLADTEDSGGGRNDLVSAVPCFVAPRSDIASADGPRHDPRNDSIARVAIRVCRLMSDWQYFSDSYSIVTGCSTVHYIAVVADTRERQ